MLKFLKILFFVLVLTALFSSGLFFSAKSAKASDMKYEFQVPISTEKAATFDGSTEPIGKYIQGIYKYAIGVVAVIATVIMMFGGFLWIVAGGNAEQIGNAKAWIGASLSGLVLVMLSYTILSFINPDLVNFEKKYITSIKDTAKGCCQWDDADDNFLDSADGYTKSKCECDTTEKDCDQGKYFGYAFQASETEGCVPKGEWWFPYICSLTEGDYGPFKTEFECKTGLDEYNNDAANVLCDTLPCFFVKGY